MALFPHLFFGTLREHYLLLFGMAGGIALVAGFLGAWVGARFGARAAARRAVVQLSREAGNAPELRAMKEGLDELLLELERVAEAQRFTARILADRERGAALPAPAPIARREPGQITPH